MGQRLTLAVQGKMDVVKINGYDDDDDDDDRHQWSTGTGLHAMGDFHFCDLE